jgi:hypothetical protein
MIAYRIQEEAFGGLDRETIKLLDRLARGKPDELSRRLKAGTVLIREYQGQRLIARGPPRGTHAFGRAGRIEISPPSHKVQDFALVTGSNLVLFHYCAHPILHCPRDWWSVREPLPIEPHRALPVCP